MKAFICLVKALADESRARILALLGEGELCVCQIIEMLALAPSTVSKHLAILDHAGLIEHRKDGRWVYYRLADKGSPQSVRGALRWVLKALADDPDVQRDLKRLTRLCKRDTTELSACCYGKQAK